jgi:hypothetical protein
MTIRTGLVAGLSTLALLAAHASASPLSKAKEAAKDAAKDAENRLTDSAPDAAPGTTTTEADEPSKATATIDDKARALIEKNIELMGGREAMEKIKSRRDTGTFNMPAAGISGTINNVSDSSGRFQMKIGLGPIGEQQAGFDGTNGWSMDPIQGPTLAAEDTLDDLKRQGDLRAALNYEKYYTSIKYAGEQTFDGQAVEAVKLTDHDGNVSTQYFSKETGRLVGETGQTDSPQGTLNMTMVYSEYKQFGPFTMATKSVVKMGPIEQTITITDVTFDDATEADFVLPEPVAKLIATQKTDAAKP